MRLAIRFLQAAAVALVSANASAEVPAASVTAISVPGTTIFGATTIDMARLGYVEEEFYISGTASRYRIANPLATAEVIDGGHPYKSRIVVRRPARANDFNGIVVVEWYNVTAGQDVDFTFAAMRDHLLREGYAFVAVSAQLVGIDALRRVDPKRYGTLGASASNVDPVTNGPVDIGGGPGGATKDVLSWDIFGQTGAALRSSAGTQALGGLKPRYVIALGESQSAGRLTVYYNAIQPLHRVYDAFLTYDRSGVLRDDTGTKSISIGTEFSGTRAAPPEDSVNHRWWEVAGSSHVSVNDLFYLDPIIKRDGAFRSPTGVAMSLTDIVAVGQCQATPIWSRVPSGHALNAALEQLVAWVAKGTAPPKAPRLTRDAAGKVVRDSEGRVSGGIRLAAYEAPSAQNSGVNSGPGFCTLAGQHTDFTPAQLCERYGSPDRYVSRVTKAAEDARKAGFQVKADQLADIRDARKLRFSCGQ